MPDDLDLLTIGDFARVVGLPTSALRHYDECGLLIPARTDASTGYRYYTPALERRARLIAAMRDVGVPIDTMQRVLDGTPEDARALLDEVVAQRQQQASLSREVADTVLAALAAERTTNTVRVRVEGPALAAALRQVRCAADAQPTSALACVLLDARDGELDVVATNRHWLARRTLAANGEPRGAARAVLRLAAVEELVDRLDDALRADVEVVLGGDGLAVHLDDARFLMPTSELPYPSYRLVIAALDVPTTRVVVARDEFLEAVSCARRSVVELHIDGQLAVAGAAVPAVVRGTPLAVNVRAALLSRAVGSCVGDRVALALSAPDRPVVVSSPDQTGYSAVAMPTLEPA